MFFLNCVARLLPSKDVAVIALSLVHGRGQHTAVGPQLNGLVYFMRGGKRGARRAGGACGYDWVRLDLAPEVHEEFPPPLMSQSSNSIANRYPQKKTSYGPIVMRLSPSRTPYSKPELVALAVGAPTSFGFCFLKM